MIRLRLIAPSLLLCCIVACTTGDLISGGTTETGNAKYALVTGYVVDREGRGAQSVVVRMLPEKYNPLIDTFNVDSLIDTTTSQGAFAIRSVPPGGFTLSASNLEYGTGTIRFRIAVPWSCSSCTVPVDTTRLTTPGKVFVKVDTSIYVSGSAVYVPGTRLYAAVDTMGYAVLDSIHAEQIDLKYYDVASRRNLAYLTNVRVGDTCVVSRSSFSSSIGAFSTSR